MSSWLTIDQNGPAAMVGDTHTTHIWVVCCPNRGLLELKFDSAHCALPALKQRIIANIRFVRHILNLGSPARLCNAYRHAIGYDGFVIHTTSVVPSLDARCSTSQRTHLDPMEKASVSNMSRRYNSDLPAVFLVRRRKPVIPALQGTRHFVASTRMHRKS